MHKLTSDEEKQMRIAELFPVLMKYPNLMKFFDIRSNKLLDEKIDVLEKLSAGKNIEDIPGFYDIFELTPRYIENVHSWTYLKNNHELRLTLEDGSEVRVYCPSDCLYNSEDNASGPYYCYDINMNSLRSCKIKWVSVFLNEYSNNTEMPLKATCIWFYPL